MYSVIYDEKTDLYYVCNGERKSLGFRSEAIALEVAARRNRMAGGVDAARVVQGEEPGRVV
jgi:hypothetical protein